MSKSIQIGPLHNSPTTGLIVLSEFELLYRRNEGALTNSACVNPYEFLGKLTNAEYQMLNTYYSGTLIPVFTEIATVSRSLGMSHRRRLTAPSS